MPIQSLTYDPPVKRRAPCETRDYDLLEAAGELAQRGEFVDACRKVLQHLLPTSTIPDLVTQPLIFTQGSSVVTIRVDGDDLLVRVPLIRLSEDGRAVAALRYVLTRIAGSGQLYQPRLVGDDIYLEYRDALSRLHPAKVLEVVERMPKEADDSDDLLMGQFGALALDRAPIEPLDDAEFARCEAIWASHFAVVDELLKECQRKRSYFFLNELTAYTINQILFALPLVGHLLSRLRESASTFNDSDEDPNKREAVLARYVKDMKVVTSEELRKCLGHATYGINPLSQGTSRVLRGHLAGDYMETVNGLRSSGKTFDAAVGLFGTYIYLLARFWWPEAIETAMKDGLLKASGKSWKEIASILCTHAEGLVADFTDDEDDEEEDDEEEDDDQDDAEDDEEEGAQ